MIERGESVLMGKRRGSHGAGTWCFPGGHIDFGEEPATAVRREILEETGLHVGAVHVYKPLPWVCSHFPETKSQYITLYFTAEFLSGIPERREPEKCEGWEWIDWKQPPSPLFAPLEKNWSRLRTG